VVGGVTVDGGGTGPGVAATHAAQWPEHVDEVFLFNLAQFWWSNASDLEVSRVEENEMRAEMEVILTELRQSLVLLRGHL